MKQGKFLVAFGQGWRKWLVGIFGFLLVAALILSWLFNRWIDDQSDLAGIDARARGMALPVTWSEVGLKVSSAERIALWNEISKTVVSLPAWKEDGDHSALVTGLPLPVSLLSHHNRLDAREMKRLLDCIDALGPDQLVFRSEVYYNTQLPEVSTYSNVVELLGQRVLLATNDQLGDECRRMLKFIHTYQVSTTINEFFYIPLMEIALNQMTMRLPDLKIIPRRELCAELVLGDANLLSAGEIQAWQSDFIVNRTYFGNARDANISRLGQAKSDHPPLYQRIREMSLIKQSRAVAFSNYLNYIEFIKGKPSAVDLMAQNRFLESTVKSFQKMEPIPPSTILYSLFLSGCTDLGYASRSTVLHAQLLAAEMNGEPWPIDDFSGGTKGRLQKVLVDGRLIGAFSCTIERAGDSSHFQPLAWDLYGSVKDWQKAHRLVEHDSPVNE